MPYLNYHYTKYNLTSYYYGNLAKQKIGSKVLIELTNIHNYHLYIPSSAFCSLCLLVSLLKTFEPVLCLDYSLPNKAIIHSIWVTIYTLKFQVHKKDIERGKCWLSASGKKIIKISLCKRSEFSQHRACLCPELADSPVLDSLLNTINYSET